MSGTSERWRASRPSWSRPPRRRAPACRASAWREPRARPWPRSRWRHQARGRPRPPCVPSLLGPARRVLVPVRLAHPAEPVLLAGLLREVVDCRLVRLDPEPLRADAFAQGCLVRHVGASFARRRSFGVAADIHHSAGDFMQGSFSAGYCPGRSPGYRLRTRWSSSGVSPRPNSRREPLLGSSYEFLAELAVELGAPAGALLLAGPTGSRPTGCGLS